MSNRFDFLIIEEMVELGSKVLDIGCDDGSLLKMLQDKKKVDVRGIELYSDRVNLCLEKGLQLFLDRDQWQCMEQILNLVHGSIIYQ